MKSYKKLCMKISICFIAYLLLRELISYLLRLFVENVTLDAYGYTLLNGASYILLIGLSCIIVAYSTNTKLRTVFQPWKKDREEYYPLLTLNGMGLIIVANVAVSYLAEVMSMFGIKNVFPTSTILFSKEQTGGILLYIFINAVLAGFLEEILFRGLIMKNFLKYGENTAIIVSAFFFGILHMYPGQVIFAFVVGIVLAKADIKVGSIKIGILLHVLNNYLASLLSLSYKYMDYEKYALLVISLYFFIAVFGLIAGVMIRKLDAKKKETASLINTEEEVEPYKVLLNPGTIVFFVIILVYIWWCLYA